jgi:hypothetical protein
MGSLAAQPQPTLAAGDGVLLRPWTLRDAEAVMDAYRDGEIQRWHVRRADSVAEAQEWIAGRQGGWATEKTGFAVEGVRRSAWLQTDGRHDVHVHARLRSMRGTR